MLFRRLILSALLVGVVAGLLQSVIQINAVDPILFESEAFEVEGAHDHNTHDHSMDAWSPEDGAERTAYTVLSSIMAGVGYAAVLLALMVQIQSLGLVKQSLSKGALWGLGGFIAFFVAPAIGIPPEIPGINAAPVEQRQLWWLLVAVSVGVALLLLAFAPIKFKAVALPLLVLPYFFVPHHEGALFLHPDAQAVESLTALHQQFIIMSGMTNAIFWLCLGLLSAVIIRKWVVHALPDDCENSVSV